MQPSLVHLYNIYLMYIQSLSRPSDDLSETQLDELALHRREFTAWRHDYLLAAKHKTLCTKYNKAFNFDLR